ncbi:hypothetical protein D0863_04164 [Hortaea werneckii]|uniref:Moybdenum cofactor oxidoreductase dimerisation domain-containing protein n=1 Tax=Hortaea werneckii TaxID=91943 RepID=A0A3M7EAD5_HORWE|nr:hypothetical protein D0863_04164 [Hortaea werneckii]
MLSCDSMNSGLVDHYELAKGDCKTFEQLLACHSIRTCRNAECLRRHAFFGGGRHIMRVDVSPGIKEMWQQAHIESDQEQKDRRTWRWRHRHLAIPTRLSSCTVYIKAADNAILDAYYKFCGNLASGEHRMPKQEALHAAVLHWK